MVARYVEDAEPDLIQWDIYFACHQNLVLNVFETNSNTTSPLNLSYLSIIALLTIPLMSHPWFLLVVDKTGPWSGWLHWLSDMGYLI